MSRPAVGRPELVQRRAGAVMVVCQDGPADAGDVEKAELAGQEPADGGLVGRVQHRPAGAAAAGDLIAQL